MENDDSMCDNGTRVFVELDVDVDGRRERKTLVIGQVARACWILLQSDFLLAKPQKNVSGGPCAEVGHKRQMRLDLPGLCFYSAPDFFRKRHHERSANNDKKGRWRASGFFCRGFDLLVGIVFCLEEMACYRSKMPLLVCHCDRVVYRIIKIVFKMGKKRK